MIKGKDILYISSIEWNFLWQGHQEIALRLAAEGNRVLYVENTGVRSPGIRDAGRVLTRARRWLSSTRTEGARQIAPNVYVCSPIVLPPFGGSLRQTLNRRIFIPLLLRSARRLGMKSPLLWTYLPNDTTVDLIRKLRGELTGLVYYCVADFTQLTPHVSKLQASEREIVESSNVVFTNCNALRAKFLPWNRNTHVFPFGVDMKAFPFQPLSADASQVSANGHQLSLPPTGPQSLQSVSRPVIGYVGGMHRHVDFSLLQEMAVRRPEWTWVYVGARQAAMGDLQGLPNVQVLGQRPHAELVDFIRGFDVCIVPYVDSVYTATVVPTKINEYLAAGKPVVSTALPPVVEFNEKHGILLTTEANPQAFLDAIDRALSLPSDDATVSNRRRVAELADWNTLFASMCNLIETRVFS